MTTLTKHPSNETTKMLLIGNTGAGKTGALASLVGEGYKLFIVDFDNGLDVLKNIVLDKYADKAENVQYKTFADDVSFQGNGLVVKSAKAFEEGMKSLAKWSDEGKDYGSIWTWGPDTIVVIDSLSLMGRMAMNKTLSLNNRLATSPTQSDWGDAQDEIENLLAMLYAPSVKCNVIVMSHIVQIENANGVNEGFPMTLGKALSPKVGRYFNTMFLMKTVGLGAAKKRVIRTVPDGSISVKHPLVGRGLPDELPIETGLATFFRMLREKNGVATQTKAA